jgi:hypothetical protein
MGRETVYDARLLGTYAGAMPRVLLNFQHYGNAWSVHFIEADCRTTIGSRTRFYGFSTLDALHSFVTRCQPGVPRYF